MAEVLSMIETFASEKTAFAACSPPSHKMGEPVTNLTVYRTPIPRDYRGPSAKECGCGQENTD